VIKKARGDVAKSVKREAEAEFVGVGEDTNCWLTRDHAEESIFVIKTGEDAVKSASREAEAESVSVREVSSCWLTEDHAKKHAKRPVQRYTSQCVLPMAGHTQISASLKLPSVKQRRKG